jgi:glycosyltransferase involved in cell wall biosynthesis
MTIGEIPSTVSAILVTRGRREWAREALRSFAAQDYPRKHIVIVDDELEPSFLNVPRSFPMISASMVYIKSPERRIGAKRNMACELAAGEIIIHWDSDDWSDVSRISDQVARLQQSGKQVTGYHSMLFYDVTGTRCAKFQGYPGDAIGTSLCYYKSYWNEHRFEDSLRIYEDNKFTKVARDVNQLASVDAGSLMVARIHSDNTDPKSLDRDMFAPVSLDALPEAFPR